MLGFCVPQSVADNIITFFSALSDHNSLLSLPFLLILDTHGHPVEVEIQLQLPSICLSLRSRKVHLIGIYIEWITQITSDLSKTCSRKVRTMLFRKILEVEKLKIGS